MADITLDLDDCVYPCVQTIKQYLVDKRGYHHGDLITPHTWDLHEHWRLGYDELWTMIREGVQEGYIFTQGLPLSGSKYAIDELRKDGHKINFVTARVGRGKVGMAKRWLKAHKIKYDSLTFSEDKTVVPADFSLDDRAENFVHLFHHSHAFLMDQPWNRYDFTSRRVYSMTDFLWRVREELGDSRCRPSTLATTLPLCSEE